MSGVDQRGGFFAHFLAALDGPEPSSAIALVGEDLRFGLLVATDTAPYAAQVLGGAAELCAYVDDRDPPPWTHHITHAELVAGVELALGETRQPDGSVAATFVCAAQLGSDGRAQRYLAGRSPGVRLAPSPERDRSAVLDGHHEAQSGFFARYFAALDGPDPLSALELVADGAQFALLFAAGTDGRSRQFIGGRDELRSFTEAGDMRGWAHYILRHARLRDVELVLGETRRDDGTHIGTFICAVQVDGEGLMTRYLTARTAGLAFNGPR